MSSGSKELVGHYARPDNPLFIPEANHARLPETGANLFFAIGEQGRVRGFRPSVSFEGKVDDAPQSVVLGDFQFKVSFVDPWIPPSEQHTIAHGGLLVQLGPEEYLAAGSGFVLEMAPRSPGPPLAGIESIYEGRFEAGRWKPGRLLNGDESHQGRHLRIPPDAFAIQRLKLYRYR